MITRVPRRQLIDFTRFVAAEVAAGRCPYVCNDADQRRRQRVHRDPCIDIWLISWLPSDGTQLHDHGGCSGALTVLRGALTEVVPSQAGIRATERSAGVSVGFGPHYIHDMRNLGGAPAVSVHAYSPPLATMNHYDLRDTRIVRRSIATGDPETTALTSAS